MGRVTAALIVRNESGTIEGCLQSLTGQVDEIVVVDTGSRDDTVAKIKRFPVNLHRFDWCDDFSAARNFAIDHARGDWILYIDADERLAAPGADNLAKITADDSKVAWNVRFHPRVDWTPYAEIRLFRNDPRIRFRGAIHETMLGGIEIVRQADGKEIGDCDLVLQHVGYESDQAYKNARNIPLLRARLKQEPDHLYSWWHLGECLCLGGDEDAADAAWSEGADRARALPDSARKLSDAQSVTSLIRLRISRGQDASELLRAARERYPDHLSLQWIEATIALVAGDLGAARPVLQTLASIDADSFYDPRISYQKAIFRWLAKEALALCHFRAGDYAEAARLYRLAAVHSPDRQACALKALLAERRAKAQAPSQLSAGRARTGG
ncbi:MAG: glycosyltransferase [Xanthobacteraceae bacterium]|nr:glycosyltransferase [Xanthobacteraceae bacterium]